MIEVVRHRRYEIEGLYLREVMGSVLMNVMNGDWRRFQRVEEISSGDSKMRRKPYLTLFRVDRYEMQAQPHTAR